MAGQRQLNNRQIAALRHPIRFRILELFTTETGRSLAVADLASDLERQFTNVSLSQINYHLRQLQHVKLLPLVAN